MEPHRQNIWNLLTRVLSGEAGPAEQKKLNQWLGEDPANRAFFEQVQTRWAESPDKNAVHNRLLFDHESGVSRLRYKIREEKQGKAFQGASPPGRNTRKLSGWAIAASILLVVGILSVWAGIRSWSPALTTYETSRMEQRIITLPDGSTVRLNKNSAISLRKGLKGANRKIRLRGEAFFEVNHDASRPFVIHAGDAIVRDIGTSFNVKQQRDGKVVVAMKEGKASLRARGASRREASVLTKNQIGILNKGQVSAAPPEDIQNYLSWINGRLVFRDMQLAQVVRQLDHIYGIRSSLGDAALATLPLTAYTSNTSLEEVLDMIALSLGIAYRKEGQTVVWRKNKPAPKPQPTNIPDTTLTKD